MSSRTTRATLWRNARIATCAADMQDIQRGAIVTLDDRIEWLGPADELPGCWKQGACAELDLHDRWVTPGLVDCHTHLVFAGNRAAEWSELLKGVSYEEIARRGGGILSTVKATRRASEAQLFDESAPRLECMLDEGVTTLEIKSGYGLTLEDERKMLRVARELGSRYPVTIRTTFLAAHAIPPEFSGRPDDYIDALAERWLPALDEEGLIDAVDVFCERVAFTTQQAQRVLLAAQKRGLAIRLHAEQLSNIGATKLATQLRASSCDHLEHAGEEEAKAMASSGTVAVLLPTAFLHLHETKLPPIEWLRAYRTAIALASDCNPGSSPSASLLLAAALGTRLFRLTPREALAGITRHAAQACGASRRGALGIGACADFAVWAFESLEEIVYWMNRHRPIAVVRNGRIVRGALA